MGHSPSKKEICGERALSRPAFSEITTWSYFPFLVFLKIGVYMFLPANDEVFKPFKVHSS